jgi:putative transposase
VRSVKEECLSRVILCGEATLYRALNEYVEHYQQHLDNLRQKDSLRGTETTEISVRLGNDSASHFEGSAYHHERNHQGKGNVLLFPAISQDAKRAGPIECRERLGGLLRYYAREAA